MCLLIVAFQTHPDAPLVVAANRDEFLARPAVAMTVLSATLPRIVGGRDKIAGGTWLAVNEHGLFAGLTNVPGARDPAKRSRGLMPLMLARHKTATDAVNAFGRDVRPQDFSPAWLLVGDRASLFFIDMASGSDRVMATALSPGLYVLENSPLFAPSPKVAMVTAALQGIETARGDALLSRLTDTLRSHDVPVAVPAPAPVSAPALPFIRPRETYAPCVHAGPYGTRSSLVAVFPENAKRAPDLFSADGPPCTASYVDVTHLWAR